MTWDPAQYLKYAEPRGRPFFDLLTQVGASAPRVVVDIGCGPGNLTASLRERWPAASIIGVDSSPAMLELATPLASDGLDFVLGDARTWVPSVAVDVIVSNATLQWVEGHDELVVRWIDHLAPGGWLAFQVPGNFDGASHTVIRDVLASARWRDRVPPGTDIASARSHDPDHYLGLLVAAGARVNAWETTYLHVLDGDDAVLEWLKGTTLRPILDTLPDPATRTEFLTELAAALRAAYPVGDHGTVFPFRRVFVVAQRPA